jgi:hypothetical protein
MREVAASRNPSNILPLPSYSDSAVRFDRVVSSLAGTKMSKLLSHAGEQCKLFLSHGIVRHDWSSSNAARSQTVPPGTGPASAIEIGAAVYPVRSRPSANYGPSRSAKGVQGATETSYFAVLRTVCLYRENSRLSSSSYPPCPTSSGPDFGGGSGRRLPSAKLLPTAAIVATGLR